MVYNDKLAVIPFNLLSSNGHLARMSATQLPVSEKLQILLMTAKCSIFLVSFAISTVAVTVFAVVTSLVVRLLF